ncbi:MAG: sugar transferase [Hyphomonadaceae bacterium]
MRINANVSGVEAPPARPRRTHAYSGVAQPLPPEGAVRTGARRDAAQENIVAPSSWAEPAQSMGGGDPPLGGWLKRAFDICFSAGALLVLAPALLLIALVIRLDSKGPAIFKQDRGGLSGKRFKIWKFRTMTVVENDAGAAQAVRGDSRVTRVGRFLRKTSIDEFPQLVNVLVGDMSIVGPRPHIPKHDAEFTEVDPRYPERMRARPGMTGLAQISGCRGPTQTEEAIRARTGFDVLYVATWTFIGDVAIIAKTALLIWNDPQAF